MTVKELEVLYGYGYWANKKLFAALAQLAPEQFAQPVAGGHKSIRNTLVHIMSAEAGWLDRCGGPERGPRLNPADFVTLESVMQPWNTIEAQVRAFLAQLKDEDLARDIEFSFDPSAKYTMRLGELMQHAAVHGTHHRGQIAMMLRTFGHAPGNFDMLFYYAEKSGPFAG